MKTNENHWTWKCFHESYGKGAAFEVSVHGYNQTEMNHIGFNIRRNEDYETIPKRRKLVMESVYKQALVHSTGICWICGETHPRVIERHHLYEKRKENTLIDDFVSGICANCHRKRKVTGGETERHQIAILKAIEREWFGLGGDTGDER